MKLMKKTLIDFLKRNNLESTHEVQEGVVVRKMPGELSHKNNNNKECTTLSDLSDTSESDEDKKQSAAEKWPVDPPLYCPVKHEGRMLFNEILPLHVDDLFTLLFTYNQFNMDLMESLKYTDVNFSKWGENPATGLKMRVSHLVVPVNQPVGPKSCQVTETQVMQSCSKPGDLYVIEVEAVNAGVPYCDSFYISNHFCLTRVSNTEASFVAYSQIKYRKSVWGLVKSFIEKNVWAGMEDYFKVLGKALEQECMRKQLDNEGEITRSRKQESTRVTTTTPQVEHISAAVTTPVPSFVPNSNDLALWAILGILVVLLLFNAVLFYKLSVLEDFDQDSRLSSTVDPHVLGSERSHEEWISLLQKQAIQHQKEIQQWKTALKSVLSILNQAEESIINLQNNIQFAASGRVVSALILSKSDDTAQSSTRNEL